MVAKIFDYLAELNGYVKSFLPVPSHLMLGLQIKVRLCFYQFVGV